MAGETVLHQDKNDTTKLDSFRFKALVLCVLVRGFCQNIMRSIKAVCTRARNHHGAYMKDTCNTHSNLCGVPWPFALLESCTAVGHITATVVVCACTYL